jgi:hypothetical protein
MEEEKQCNRIKKSQFSEYAERVCTAWKAHRSVSKLQDSSHEHFEEKKLLFESHSTKNFLSLKSLSEKTRLAISQIISSPEVYVIKLSKRALSVEHTPNFMENFHSSFFDRP